jgi:peptide subunit release factor RF-3
MLVSEAAKPFDVQSFLEGHMTPVFFGSALRHFGVSELLAGIGAYAPPPHPAKVDHAAGVETHVAPGDSEVSGFVFKVQANMDPNHRDRIAFLRLTSGRFTRGMKLKAQNTGKSMSVNAPVMFFASDRELAEDAFAGDVIGIPNHGVLRVGDSLSEAGTAALRRPAQLRPGNPAPRAGQGSAEGQAPEEGAGRPGRGRRHPAVPSRCWAAPTSSSAPSASCSSRSWPTGWAANTSST